MDGTAKPRLAKGVRLRTEGDAMLLIPEGVLMLNGSAAATLELVDGTRSVDQIADALVRRFDVENGEARAGVLELLERLHERRLVDIA